MLNIYYYGETGAYDAGTPMYALEQEGAMECLMALAQGTAFPDVADATRNALINTGFIEQRNGTLCLAFPFFMDSDVPLLNELVAEPAAELTKFILRERPWLYQRMQALGMPFEPARLLYHCLCDRVFDGTAFAWLGSRMSSSKIQPNGRDYIPIAFEVAPAMNHLADQVLCSSHNLSVGNMGWNSFGDGDGTRRDLFRLTRTLAKVPGKLNFFVSEDHAWILDDLNAIASQATDFILRLTSGQSGTLTKDKQKVASLLCDLGYLDIENHLLVPLFPAEAYTVVDEITQRIMPCAEAQYLKILDSLTSGKHKLAAMNHDIPVEQLGNELWHQLFGRVNEQLVEQHLVATPSYVAGEGRYLKSIWMNK